MPAPMYFRPQQTGYDRTGPWRLKRSYVGCAMNLPILFFFLYQRTWSLRRPIKHGAEFNGKRFWHKSCNPQSQRSLYGAVVAFLISCFECSQILFRNTLNCWRTFGYNSPVFLFFSRGSFSQSSGELSSLFVFFYILRGSNCCAMGQFAI